MALRRRTTLSGRNPERGPRTRDRSTSRSSRARSLTRAQTWRRPAITRTTNANTHASRVGVTLRYVARARERDAMGLVFARDANEDARLDARVQTHRERDATTRRRGGRKRRIGRKVCRSFSTHAASTASSARRGGANGRERARARSTAGGSPAPSDGDRGMSRVGVGYGYSVWEIGYLWLANETALRD